MNVYNCEYCETKFKSLRALKKHQKTAKYCLKKRGIDQKDNFQCLICKKTLTTKHRLKTHQSICIPFQLKLNNEKWEQKMTEKMTEKDTIIISLKKQLDDQKKQHDDQKKYYEKKLSSFQKDMKDVAMKAVSRPISNITNKTIQINNYIKNMQPLSLDHIKENIPMLTLDHHVKGPEGYAEYALEFPFKDRIVCVDVARNKIKYKNEEGDIIEDPGFRKMMLKLCEALKDRTFKLCQEHYEKLAPRFSEEEMDSYDFMEAAKAIHKYANGRENDFCSKLIKLISKGSKVRR
jgi:hypothetical protein